MPEAPAPASESESVGQSFNGNAAEAGLNGNGATPEAIVRDSRYMSAERDAALNRPWASSTTETQPAEPEGKVAATKTSRHNGSNRRSGSSGRPKSSAPAAEPPEPELTEDQQAMMASREQAEARAEAAGEDMIDVGKREERFRVPTGLTSEGLTRAAELKRLEQAEPAELSDVKSELIDYRAIKDTKVRAAREKLAAVTELGNRIANEGEAVFQNARELATANLIKLHQLDEQRSGAVQLDVSRNNDPNAIITAMAELNHSKLQREDQPFEVQELRNAEGKVIGQELIFHTGDPQVISVETWDLAGRPIRETKYPPMRRPFLQEPHWPRTYCHPLR